MPRDKTKHVWIINHYAQQPGGVGGTRHYSLAKHLMGHDWDSTIIASSVDHFSGSQRLEDKLNYALERYDGVQFLWLRTSDYSGNGAGRIKNIIEFTRRVLNPTYTSELKPPDLIIGSSVHPLAAWAGLKLSKRFNVPFIFEVRDLWPETLIAMGQLSNWHPAAIALRALEKHLYFNSDRIVTLLPLAHNYIESFNIISKKIVWIPNGADLDLFRENTRPKAKPEPFTIVYFGSHGIANGLETLLRAMEIVESASGLNSIKLRLIGDGPEKPRLIKLASEMQLKNVRFDEPVPKEEIPSIAGNADCFVICIRDLPRLYKFGVSMNKLFDYMALGRPIVMSADIPANPISLAGAGITVPPDDADKLAAAMLDIAALPLEKRREMGDAGRRAIESEFSMESLAERLAKTLNECVNQIGV